MDIVKASGLTKGPADPTIGGWRHQEGGAIFSPGVKIILRKSVRFAANCTISQLNVQSRQEKIFGGTKNSVGGAKKL